MRKLTSRTSCWRPGGAATLVVVLALMGAVVGCGGDSNDSGDSNAASGSGTSSSATDANVAAAEKAIAPLLEPGEWKGPDATFDASALKGKTVWAISVGNAIPVVQYYVDNLGKALDAAGATLRVFDGKLSLDEFLRGTSQAVAQKADAIVLIAIPAEAIAAPLKAAKAANIPVVVTHDVDAGEPLPDGVTGAVRLCHTCVGEALANWVVADSKAKANVLVFSVSNATNAGFELNGLKSQLAAKCPGCKVTVIDAPNDQWDKLPGQTRSALQRDPDINYIVPMYDGMAATILPTVAQLGRTDSVQLASFNGTPSVMKQLSPTGGVGADIGSADEWMSWAMADQSLRLMAGEAPIEDYNVPLRLFTRDNVSEIDVNGDPATWFGPVDFKSKFKALWGE